MRLTAAWWLCRCCLLHIYNRLSTTSMTVYPMTWTSVNDNWISSRLRPPSSWCAFQSSSRKNDVEGCHKRLNQMSCHGILDLYKLAPVLYREAQYVILQAVLDSLCPKTACMHRHQKQAHKRTQGLLSKYWESYAAGEITIAQPLRKCSCV